MSVCQSQSSKLIIAQPRGIAVHSTQKKMTDTYIRLTVYADHGQQTLTLSSLTSNIILSFTLYKDPPFFMDHTYCVNALIRNKRML